MVYTLRVNSQARAWFSALPELSRTSSWTLTLLWVRSPGFHSRTGPKSLGTRAGQGQKGARYPRTWGTSCGDAWSGVLSGRTGVGWLCRSGGVAGRLGRPNRRPSNGLRMVFPRFEGAEFISGLDGPQGFEEGFPGNVCSPSPCPTPRLSLEWAALRQTEDLPVLHILSAIPTGRSPIPGGCPPYSV